MDANGMMKVLSGKDKSATSSLYFSDADLPRSRGVEILRRKGSLGSRRPTRFGEFTLSLILSMIGLWVNFGLELAGTCHFS